jgi:diguanylate cyclase
LSGAPAVLGQTPAQIAKAVLRRLATSQLEPTPENYARVWAEEAGDAVPALLPERAKPLIERLVVRVVDEPALRDELARCLMQGRWDDLQRALERSAESAAAATQAWAVLLERIARGVERGGRQWTTARKKESLQRVLDSSRSDMQRLQQRLKQLVGSWESDGADEKVNTGMAELDEAPATPTATPVTPPAPAGDTEHGTAAQDWPAIVGSLGDTLQTALPGEEPRAAELADELAALAARIASEGATPELVLAVSETCERARRLLAHRHHLVEQLGALCLELTAGLTELAEEHSWAQGQSEAMRARLGDDGGVPSVRGVRAASELLAETRARQQVLRSERERARDALKGLIQSLLLQIGELGDQTGRFSDSLGRYAEVITQADSLDSLAGLVRDMVEESRSVQSAVDQTRQRMGDEQGRAGELEARVRELEGELRRLSDEVATDVLTQVANRRGMMQSFEAERARMEREGTVLAVGLIDIDNFKKLNDTLGHSVGDEALKALAQRVRDSLRPVDHVARFGGEEFVVLLPGTPPDEAQQVLSRLQRQLTASLFMHDGREVFVTFSAGVTSYRLGERIEAALERADEALYEAKRTGKNRTCVS